MTLPCAYDTPGVLRNRYHVEWYRGHREPLQNSNTQLPQRYTVNEDDFSLTIRNANVDDSSQAYYCALRVENLEASRDIYRLGPTFELRVQSKQIMLHAHAPLSWFSFSVSLHMWLACVLLWSV